MLSNGAIAELLAQKAERAEGTWARALRRGPRGGDPRADSARAASLSPEQESKVAALLKAGKATSATITSTNRTPEDQARAMFANLEGKGVASQRDLYSYTKKDGASDAKIEE